MINKLHGVKFLLSKKGYLKLAEEIKEFYKNIEADNYQQSEHYPLTRDDYMRERVVGDQVAYLYLFN